MFFRPNYWLTNYWDKENFMVVDLGCVVLAKGFKMRSTHNSIWDNFATKGVKIRIKRWDTLAWKELLSKDLPDPRGQVINIL